MGRQSPPWLELRRVDNGAVAAARRPFVWVNLRGSMQRSIEIEASPAFQTNGGLVYSGEHVLVFSSLRESSCSTEPPVRDISLGNGRRLKILAGSKSRLLQASSVGSEFWKQ